MPISGFLTWILRDDKLEITRLFIPANHSFYYQRIKAFTQTSPKFQAQKNHGSIDLGRGFFLNF